MEKIHDDLSVENSRRGQSSLPRPDLRLTFRIEIHTLISWNESKVGRNQYRDAVRRGIAEEGKPQSHSVLQFVRGILWQAGLDASSAREDEKDEDDEDESVDEENHSSWRLTEDSSAHGRHPSPDLFSNKPENLSKEICAFKHRGRIVLVSPSFTAPRSDQAASLSHPSLREIERYIVALKGENTYSFTCLQPENSRIKIHVGVAARRNPNLSAKFPLLILQHLCAIILQHETVISRLFPSRRQITSRPIGGSDPQAPHRDSSPRPRNLQQKIFAQNTTIARISTLPHQTPTGHKSITLPNPTTLTIHPTDPTTIPIKQTILFILALTRAAERKARKEEEAEAETTETATSHLLTLLKLVPFQREYWHQHLATTTTTSSSPYYLSSPDVDDVDDDDDRRESGWVRRLKGKTERKTKQKGGVKENCSDDDYDDYYGSDGSSGTW